MQNISSFLDKFKTIIKDDKELKNIILLVIKKNTNLQIKDSSFSVKNGIILIKEKPPIKNEIFMKKEKILNELKQLLKKNTISDIR